MTKRSINNQNDVVQEPVPSMLDCRIEMTGVLLIPEFEIQCLKADGRPGHFSRLLCFNSLT